MNKIFIVLSLVCCVLLSGCGEEDNVLPAQKKNIVGYLTGSHNPKLISEADVPESIDVDPEYYTELGNVYRYIANVYDEGRDSRPEVTGSSTVTITYRAYIFENRSVSDDTVPFDSNDPALEEQMYKWGLTPGVWKFDPLVIRMGSGRIIKGLEKALLGCREQDVAEAYMTYDMAYGDKNFGIIPLESPVVWFFTVDKVE